jgi:Fe2+ or Zn2+ uptake regulation protein
MMKDRKATLIEKLKKSGLKLTPQRRAIIDVLIENTPLHPDAGLIYQEARKRVKGLSLSTVYYTLNEFSKHGMIKTLEFDRMENRYEGNTSDHLNLVCIGCGRIEDYVKPLPVSPREVEKQTGFRPQEVRFEYYGYCKECLGRIK